MRAQAISVGIWVKDGRGDTHLRERLETVRGYRVAFETPVGTFDHLGVAESACVRNDFDPELCVVPVLVAMAEHGEDILGPITCPGLPA